MKTYPTNEIKNVVLLGASGSGKTTLAEAMAFDGKVIERRGSVETDSTLSDFTDIEHIYKRSIYSTLRVPTTSAAASFRHLRWPMSG